MEVVFVNDPAGVDKWANNDISPDILKRYAEQVGERIRQRRAALGWSQRKLAYKAGLSNVTLNAIEKGITLRPRHAVMSSIAAALGVSVEDLTAESLNTEVPHTEAMLVEQLAQILPDFEPAQRRELVRKLASLTEDDKEYVLRTIDLLYGQHHRKRNTPQSAEES